MGFISLFKITKSNFICTFIANYLAGEFKLMIFLTCALYIEAKPLIEKLNLKRIDEGKFQIFKNDNITLIVTGSGRLNAAIALTYLLTKSGCSSDDFIINIGICAGTKVLGRAFLINKITDTSTNRTYYPDVLYKHSFYEGELFSGNEILSDGSYPLYDMEAAAIYASAIKFVTADRIAFIKIVSDNFSPDSVKEKVNHLMNQNMSSIEEFISNCNLIIEQSKSQIEQDVLKLFNKLKTSFYCSVTMENILSGLLKFAFSSNINVYDLIEDMKAKEIIPCTNKEEGKKALEYFKKQLL